MKPVNASDTEAGARLKTWARTNVSLIALVVALGVLYGPSLNGEILGWDDYIYVNDPVMQMDLLSALKVSFSSAYNRGYYPLLRTTYWLVLNTGLNPAVTLHALNVLLFLASTAMLFLVLQRLGLSRLHAFIACAFWSLHPLRVESVAWISSLKDMQSLALVLAAALCALPSEQRKPGPRRLLVAHFLFAGALLCKSMVMPVSAVLWLWAWSRSGWKDATFRFGGFLFLALLSGMLSLWAFSSLPPPLYPSTSALEIAVMSLHYHFDWLLRVLWPVHLAAVYPLPVNPAPAAATFMIMLLSASALALWRARQGERYWLVFLGGWLLPLVPVSGFVPLSFWGADRYTLLPMISLSALLAIGIVKLGARYKKSAIAVTISCLLCLPFLSSDRISDWHDPIALWKADAKLSGDHYVRHLNLGASYGARRQFGPARRELRKARDMAPGDEEVVAHWIFSELVVRGLNNEHRGRAALALQPKGGNPRDWAQAARLFGSSGDGDLQREAMRMQQIVGAR